MDCMNDMFHLYERSYYGILLVHSSFHHLLTFDIQDIQYNYQFRLIFEKVNIFYQHMFFIIHQVLYKQDMCNISHLYELSY